MPETTAPAQKTREELEAQAAQLAAQLDAIRAEERRRAEEEWRRRTDAEREYDEHLVASFDRRALDAQCEAARVAFEAALADTPLVKAMADYLGTLQHRRTEVYEHLNARGRLGENIRDYNLPPADIGTVQDLVTAAVQRIVASRIADENDARVLDREAAIDAAATD